MLTGLSTLVIALAVGLSAMIRLIQGMQLRQRVSMGMTGVRELAELSGILDPRDLQDAFGPPDMNRIWSQVTLASIERRRRLQGYLMSDSNLHRASIIIGVLAVGLHHWTTELLLLSAVIAQAGAWLSAFRLPR
ncbi:MAG: hypothetical protein AAFO63_07125 [Pseudomonadota bacterium]